ncbi:MAG: DUF2062 domain-containing protein [Dissulfurimicrobium hydrothermale]|uniref:DUF2062 domain-containing protein n=1 Tax=Dissulfurimicrobium hydrothermale TaxID=1750598 RepID=UPI003C70F654
MGNNMLNPLKTLRYYWLRLLRLKGDPIVTARGVAIGTFVALTPTVPLHTIIIVSLCTLLRGNIIAGVIASFLVSNPFTMLIHYYAAWKIGVWLTGNRVSWNEIYSLIKLAHGVDFFATLRHIYAIGTDIIVTMLVGGVVFALPFGVGAYFLSIYLYTARQRKKIKRYLETSNNRWLRGR